MTPLLDSMAKDDGAVKGTNAARKRAELIALLRSLQLD
jgi:hypothetical protein